MNPGIVLFAIALLSALVAILAQPTYFDLTIDDVGIAIGDAPSASTGSTARSGRRTTRPET